MLVGRVLFLLGLRLADEAVFEFWRCLGWCARVGVAQGVIAEDSPSRAMAATVIKMWPTGVVFDDGASGGVGV